MCFFPRVRLSIFIVNEAAQFQAERAVMVPAEIGSFELLLSRNRIATTRTTGHPNRIEVVVPRLVGGDSIHPKGHRTQRIEDMAAVGCFDNLRRTWNKLMASTGSGGDVIAKDIHMDFILASMIRNNSFWEVIFPQLMLKNSWVTPVASKATSIQPIYVTLLFVLILQLMEFKTKNYLIFK